MLTYSFDHVEGPIYEYLYQCLKEDILSGKIKAGEKLPSKRTFAKNHGISTITIQNAYDQLISEGYIYTLPKKGYYVSVIEGLTTNNVPKGEVSYDIEIPRGDSVRIDFSGNGVATENFPFSVWAKVSRDVMADRKELLMRPSPAGGVQELRKAIAEHLKSFRGMMVDPNQILIGAGTEYLYGILAELLGKDKIYAVENPGYRKLVQIYGQRDIECRFVDLDQHGVSREGLEETGANVAHICPTHHFPTGITMPASRRYEILAWANETADRYIIEDDYDSEFRTEGKPIPTLFSIDAHEKVIYMNTFSKSLSPTIRISYVVLPVHLVKKFYQEMSFYACTVSNFEQYTLAEFIRRGYFEKHINRMRLFYMRRRRQIIDIITHSALAECCEILENDSGLHFLIRLDTELADEEVERRMLREGIRMRSMSGYDLVKEGHGKDHLFLVNYSSLSDDAMVEAVETLSRISGHK